MDRALQYFLDQVEEAGGIADLLLLDDGLRNWMTGAAFAAGACVLAHRISQRRRSRPVLALSGEGLPLLG